MRQINLTEYVESGPHPLSVDERDAISGVIEGLTITPAVGESDEYTAKARFPRGGSRDWWPVGTDRA